MIIDFTAKVSENGDGVKIRDVAKCGDGDRVGAVRCGKKTNGETFTVSLNRVTI